jgi:carboxypeptidase C (cathepsin A)
MLMTRSFCLLTLLVLTAGAEVKAAEASRPPGHPAITNAPATGTNAPESAKKEESKPTFGTIADAARKPVLTTNSVTIVGEKVTYLAEAGMLPLLKPDGTARASVFYVAYTRQGETNAARRPITFAYNGGPGSSSV